MSFLSEFFSPATLPGRTMQIEMALVGGGGGGGSLGPNLGSTTQAGGGGGGGSVLWSRGFIVYTGVTYTVTVGGGGAALNPAAPTGPSANGSPTLFRGPNPEGMSEALGGGGATGIDFVTAPGTGQSAISMTGGGCSVTTAAPINASLTPESFINAIRGVGGSMFNGVFTAKTVGAGRGGYANTTTATCSGGGGGAAGDGGTIDVPGTVGVGGAAYPLGIEGVLRAYGGGGGGCGPGTNAAGGTVPNFPIALPSSAPINTEIEVGAGGAGAYKTTPPAPSGVANGGGGGGGAGGNDNQTRIGGNGGSGVAIIAYPDTFPAATTTGTVTQPTTRPGWRVYKFTGSGTIVFN